MDPVSSPEAGVTAPGQRPLSRYTCLTLNLTITDQLLATGGSVLSLKCTAEVDRYFRLAANIFGLSSNIFPRGQVLELYWRTCEESVSVSPAPRSWYSSSSSASGRGSVFSSAAAASASLSLSLLALLLGLLSLGSFTTLFHNSLILGSI